MALVEKDKNCFNKITEKFQYPKLYKLTENYLWEENITKKNWKDMTTSFHNRYTLLMSVQICSCYKATLLCMLQAFKVATMHQQDELEPYTLLICNIYKGKKSQQQFCKLSPFATKTQNFVSKVLWQFTFLPDFVSMTKNLTYSKTATG